MLVRGAHAEEMRGNMTDPFGAADSYDCRDSEEFVHETPGEALTDFFAFNSGLTEDAEKVIREYSLITVKAYRRKTVSGSREPGEEG